MRRLYFFVSPLSPIDFSRGDRRLIERRQVAIYAIAYLLFKLRSRAKVIRRLFRASSLRFFEQRASYGRCLGYACVHSWSRHACKYSARSDQ